jgi:hypothetical protein
MNNLLLLKAHFDDGEFNIHTLLEFVPSNRLKKLVEDDVYGYGDFCWIDFEEEEGLNELSGHELAELLYLGHIKDHLKLPFYNQLSNRFVYLAHDDGWWNKVYYRNMRDFYRMIGETLAAKLSDKGLEKNVLGLKMKRSIPNINMEVLLKMKLMMKEGILISIKDAAKSRNNVEIPIWVIGDFSNMDDMYDEYIKVVKKGTHDAKLVFDKKMREWNLYTN